MQQQNNKDKQLWELTKSYKSDYVPDVEKGLAKLKGRIEAERKTPSLVVRRYRWIKAASIALLLLGGAVLYQKLYAPKNNLQTLHATSVALEPLTLPDNSIVWLNKHSKISYSKDMATSERILTLEGEAFFEVAKNEKNPFIIKTENAHLQVIGTAFNMRAYNSEDAVEVAVKEGKVSFFIPDITQKMILQEQEKGMYKKSEQRLVKTTSNDVSDFTWKAKQLFFDETPLIEILSYLKKNFDVEIITIEDYSTCSLTSTFIDNTPSAILKRIESTFPIQLKSIDSKKYQLSGSCK